MSERLIEKGDRAVVAGKEAIVIAIDGDYATYAFLDDNGVQQENTVLRALLRRVLSAEEREQRRRREHQYKPYGNDWMSR